MDALAFVTGVVSVLSPYLVKVGEKAAEEVGKNLPEGAARVWNTIITKFKGKAAAEEAGTDFVAKPDDEDYRAAFRRVVSTSVALRRRARCLCLTTPLQRSTNYARQSLPSRPNSESSAWISRSRSQSSSGVLRKQEAY
jgi:hypothetical protein